MSYLSEPVTFNNYQEILFNPDNEKHEKQIALRIINAFLEKAKLVFSNNRDYYRIEINQTYNLCDLQTKDNYTIFNNNNLNISALKSLFADYSDLINSCLFIKDTDVFDVPEINRKNISDLKKKIVSQINNDQLFIEDEINQDYSTYNNDIKQWNSNNKQAYENLIPILFTVNTLLRYKQSKILYINAIDLCMSKDIFYYDSDKRLFLSGDNQKTQKKIESLNILMSKSEDKMKNILKSELFAHDKKHSLLTEKFPENIPLFTADALFFELEKFKIFKEKELLTECIDHSQELRTIKRL